MLNNVNEAVQWIEKQVKFKPKTDLERMRNAYKMLGIKLDHIKKIHVAGTNGKGSVCAYLTHIFMEQGLKVGTYTSPYLVRFNERIRYQFIEINDDELFELIKIIYDFNNSYEKTFGEFLSFFELLTLMSLLYFSNKKVDVMVMEVGLGGLLDATNVIDYNLSLICSIGFDHMKQLGNTLESISFNKLGILNPDNHLITTVDPSLHAYFKDYVALVPATAEYYTFSDVEKRSDLPLSFSYKDVTYELPLIGDYQMLNALLSIKAVHYLFPEISTKTIQKGLKKTIWLGRLEEVEPHIYIDGAHNTHAIDALKVTVENAFKGKSVWILFSALGDKDISGMIKRIGSFTSKIVVTTFPDSRFQDLSPFLSPKETYIPNAFEALKKMKGEMDKNTIMIITGSLHFIGYIKQNYPK
jgi:dihydrofolate synthase / folylpolyglutamate synthase